MSLLEVKNLNKIYSTRFGGNKVEALVNISFSIEEGEYVAKTLTNTLSAQVMSINGNTKRDYIENYVENMNVRDSLALRKYIKNNEPGLNFELDIEKPESLGGGSQKVFLPFNEFIFLNIAD